MTEKFLQIVCPSCGHGAFEFFEVIGQEEGEDVIEATVRRCDKCKVQVECIGDIEPEYRKAVPTFKRMELV